VLVRVCYARPGMASIGRVDLYAPGRRGPNELRLGLVCTH
jgi:hypothetical protein